MEKYRYTCSYWDFMTSVQIILLLFILSKLKMKLLSVFEKKRELLITKNPSFVLWYDY